MHRSIWLTLMALSTPWLAYANDTSVDYSASYLFTRDFELNRGGEARFNWQQVGIGVQHRLDPQRTLGLDISGGKQKWTFTQPNAWGGRAPWQTLERAGLSVSYQYVSQDGWIYQIAPGIEYAGEADAKRSDALGYGATGFIARAWSPDLLLGLGISAWSGLENTSAFPFIVIDWRISPSLRLHNPFSAGPVGPAGLELSWSPLPKLELATGATIRSYSSRLAANNTVAAGGVLEQTTVPVFVRAGYAFSPFMRLDAYLGAGLAGKLTLHDAQEREISQEKHDPAPFMAIAVSGTF